jgi:hypothetical protein
MDEQTKEKWRTALWALAIIAALAGAVTAASAFL